MDRYISIYINIYQYKTTKGAAYSPGGANKSPNHIFYRKINLFFEKQHKGVLILSCGGQANPKSRGYISVGALGGFDMYV